MMLFLMFAAMLMVTVEMEPLKLVVPDKTVCYGELGCFSDGYPFRSTRRPLSIVPQSPKLIKTKFVLNTRESNIIPQILIARQLKTIPQQWTMFKPRPTKILIHGFLDRISVTPWWQAMKDELLTYGDYNVIIVDWSFGNLPPYIQATANTRVVGAQTSELIKALIAIYGLSPKDFHIIGHSLGAHTAGYVGERTPGLGRITGLDPAGPNFQDTETEVRLDDGDAVFVDVMHTNIEQQQATIDSPLRLGFGTATVSGHVDYFPNLGELQPGCSVTNFFQNIDQYQLVIGVVETIACNHLRAVRFFIESINSNCPFTAVPCANKEDFTNNLCTSCTKAGCGYMGFHADKNIPPAGQHVNYYLTTGDAEPFCKPLVVL